MSNPDTFKSSITSIPLSKERKSEDFYNFLKFLRENNYDIDYIDLNFLARLFFFFKHLGISAYHQIYEEIQRILNFDFIKFLIFLENNNFNFNSKNAFEEIYNFVQHNIPKSQQIHELYLEFLKTQHITFNNKREYILHDKGFFEIVDYFQKTFYIDFSSEKYTLVKLLIFLFKDNTANTVENYAQHLMEKRIQSLQLLLLSNLPEDLLNNNILRNILTSEKLTTYVIDLLQNNWDQIIDSFPEDKKTSLIIMFNWIIELLNTKPQITQEIKLFYEQTLEPERILINKIVLKYNSELNQAISKFKNLDTYEIFLDFLNETQEIDERIKSILEYNECYDPAELYSLVIYETYTFQADIKDFLYNFFDTEEQTEINSLFINLFFEYIFLNLDINILSKLIQGNIIVTRKFLSFVESKIINGVFKDYLSERLKICFIHIFNQTQITGIQLKILEVSFECYKKRKISSEDFKAFINFVKKNCDTNNLVRYANMMYLSGYTSSMYLHESNEFIDFINRNLGGISFN